MLVNEPNVSKGRPSWIDSIFDLVYQTHLFLSSVFRNILKYYSAGKGGEIYFPPLLIDS